MSELVENSCSNYTHGPLRIIEEEERIERVMLGRVKEEEQPLMLSKLKGG